jgi:hypothetical protein
MIKYTRQEAKALGLPKCYGSVCTKHPEADGARFVSGSCVTCAVERNNKYRAADPEKTHQHRLRSQAKTAEKRRIDGEAKAKKLEADRLYRLANKEKFRASVLAWSAKNPEKVKLYAARTKAKNKGAVNARTVARRLAKIKRTPAWLTEDDHWLIEQAYELAALRTKLFGFSWHVDHKLPLQGKSVSGLHTPLNLQVLPATDNIRKGNRFEVV